MPRRIKASDSLSFVLKLQDVVITIFTGARGDTMRVVHLPTGITRGTMPPMNKPEQARHAMFREISAEPIEHGLLEHLLPHRKLRECAT